MDAAGEIIVRATGVRRQAADWALVLAAAAIPYRVERGGPGWQLIVGAGDLTRATAALEEFDRDEPRPAAPPAPPLVETDWGPTSAGLAMAALPLVVYRLAGPRGAHGAWFQAGSADAARILHGETWRTVTALTLHADLSHLVGNLAAGAFLATAVCRTVGPGVGAWLLLLSGAIGNGVTAIVAGAPHDAVGASTAVLGAVGNLSGLGVVRAQRAPGARGRRWVPFAAGLALLAVLGAGKGTDLTSHLFGFLAGIVLGAVAGTLPTLPRWGQYGLALAAVAVVGGCWALALGR